MEKHFNRMMAHPGLSDQNDMKIHKRCISMMNKNTKFNFFLKKESTAEIK